MTFKITAKKTKDEIEVSTNINGWTEKEMSQILTIAIKQIHEMCNKPSNGKIRSRTEKIS